jgi:LysM repeat protein
MIKLIFLTANLIFLRPESDSLRMETLNGQMVIIHQVGDKETLYALSRRYSVTVARILEFNPTADGGLEVGQLLKIPYVPNTRTQTAEGVKHKVQPKETLFSISRMYSVTVDEIKLWNNLKDNSISVGQQLLVSKAGSAQSSSTTANTAPQATGSVIATSSVATTASAPQSSVKTTHTVAMGETVYGISRMYNVSIDQLKSWNGLTTNDVKVGQVLLITQPMNQAIGSTAATSAGTIAATATLQQPTTTVQVVKKPEPVPAPAVAGAPVKISENVLGTDEVRESGLAELIEGAESGRKYLALHRTAKEGSIIKIRNELNNREVFVRVAGTLPDTGVNDKLVVKLSKSAYDRLGAIDQKFRVEVTYYK